MSTAERSLKRRFVGKWVKVDSGWWAVWLTLSQRSIYETQLRFISCNYYCWVSPLELIMYKPLPHCNDSDINLDLNQSIYLLMSQKRLVVSEGAPERGQREAEVEKKKNLFNKKRHLTKPKSKVQTFKHKMKTWNKSQNIPETLREELLTGVVSSRIHQLRMDEPTKNNEKQSSDVLSDEWRMTLNAGELIRGLGTAVKNSKQAAWGEDE